MEIYFTVKQIKDNIAVFLNISKLDYIFHVVENRENVMCKTWNDS